MYYHWLLLQVPDVFMQGLHRRNCNCWCFLWTSKVLKLAGPFCWRQWQFCLLLKMVLLPFYLVLCHFPAISLGLHSWLQKPSFLFCNLLDLLLLILVRSGKAGDVNDLICCGLERPFLEMHQHFSPSFTNFNSRILTWGDMQTSLKTSGQHPHGPTIRN